MTDTIPEATLPEASLPVAGDAEVRVVQAGVSARTPASALPINTATAAVLGMKANSSVTITGAGLVVGAGNLTGDVTLTVTKATGAEAAAGIRDDVAVTPLALATPLASINTNINLKAPINNPTFTGNVTLAHDPTASLQAVTKQYADAGLALKAPIDNPTFTGAVTLAQDPVSALQAATKQYVDNVAQGLNVKAAALVATTANITLSGNQTIDGVAVTSGQRVLVKNQTASADNGIYVSSASAWARSADMDVWAEVPSAFVFVEQGTINGDTSWVSTADPGGTLGTTPIPWSQFSGAGTYTAGTGLVLTGTQFALTGQALALNNVATVANQILYSTGVSTFAAANISSQARTLIGQPTTAGMLTTGLGLSSNGQALVQAANYAAMKVLLAISAADLTNGTTGTGSIVLANSPALITPDLGTPSAIVLTHGAGLPISTGVSGLGTGVATFLATPSSANLRAALTDETGTGPAVFGTGPTITSGVIDLAADPIVPLGAATKQYVDNNGGSFVPTSLALVATGFGCLQSKDAAANVRNMSCHVHFATADITAGSLIFGNWASDSGSGDGNVTLAGVISVNWSIAYPTKADILASGSLTVEIGATVSVPFTLSGTIPAGALFFEGAYAVPASGCAIPQFLRGQNVNTALGEASEQGTSITNKTLALNTIVNDGQPTFGAIGMVAQIDGDVPVVAIVSDSINSGWYTLNDAYNNSGWAAFAFGDDKAVLSLSSPGQSVDRYLLFPHSYFALRLQLAKLCRVTHSIVGFGANDIATFTTQTAATIQQGLQQLYETWQGSGSQLYGLTLLPITTSTDGWITVGNQTANARSGILDTINAWIRTTPRPLVGYFDPNIAVRSSGSPQKWAAPGGVALTKDGLHPGDAAGNTTVINTVVALLVPTIDVTLFVGFFPAAAVSYAVTNPLYSWTVEQAISRLSDVAGLNPNSLDLSNPFNSGFGLYLGF